MNIIPKPQKIEYFTGQFKLNDSVYIYYDHALQDSALCLVNYLHDFFNIDAIVVDTIEEAQLHIIQVNSDTEKTGSYAIDCNADGINITADNELSSFYAVQTLAQLLLTNEENEVYTNNCMIRDYPQYSYRGLHIDLARHFFGVKTLKTVIDLMSLVKLNKLHLHLTDDQGFRVEIDSYKKLNEISSFRAGTEVISNGHRTIEEASYGGYLSKKQITEVVNYAESKHIEIIPEINIPGHAVAIISAFPELSCTGASIDVRKKWGISKDLLCAGNDEMYKVVSDILDEIIPLFPSKYFHIGGNDISHDRWCNCPKCKEMLSKLGLKNYNELQSYVMNYFADYLEQKGKTVICYNDTVTENIKETVVSHYWKNKTLKQVAKGVKNGRVTIMSPPELRFDLPYSAMPLRKAYKYNPLEKHIDVTKSQYILGIEGMVWTPLIRTEEKLFFQLMPRMLALAECAWGTNNNFSDFKKSATYLLEKYTGNNFVYNKGSLKHNAKIKRNIMRKVYKVDQDTELTKENIGFCGDTSEENIVE